VAIFVFDSSALLRYHDDEAGADRVEEILVASSRGMSEICISALQWGEIAATLRKRYSAHEQETRLQRLMQLSFRIIQVDAECAVRAAAIRVDRKIGFADAFAVELALDSPEHVLITADYGFKAVADLIRIEFLPAK
jgi:PIN domain nuclease of toxin-antitoxin system